MKAVVGEGVKCHQDAKGSHYRVDASSRVLGITFSSLFWKVAGTYSEYHGA